eukprot:5361088-Pleurochrysis_carterae.AAC.2
MESARCGCGAGGGVPPRRRRRRDAPPPHNAAFRLCLFPDVSTASSHTPLTRCSSLPLLEPHTPSLQLGRCQRVFRLW